MIRRSTSEDYPEINGNFGILHGLDLLPKAIGRHLPLLAVGSARQSLQWIARNMDGWVSYFRPLSEQMPRLQLWQRVAQTEAADTFRPFAQSMFIDLAEEPNAAPEPIFLGYRLGRNSLIEELQGFARAGVHHVTFNLRHSQRPAGEVMAELAEHVLPVFPSD